MNEKERVEGFKCSECGAIEMMDVTGLTDDDITSLKECQYVCRRCQESLYPVFFGPEENENDSTVHNETNA